MSQYLALFKARFLTLFQYRAAAFAGITTQVFWGIIYSMIFAAFYKEGSHSASISLAQAVTFIWINQAFFQLVPFNIDKEIEAQIKTGNVAYELIRPLDLYWLWFCRSLALRVVPTIMRCIPLFILAGLFFGLNAPVTFQAGVCFFLSSLLSIFVSASMTTLFVISLFWTISGEGLLRLIPHVSMFLSGLVVPLPLFPDWMQPFLLLQPFRFVLDVPCRLYTGVIPAHEALLYLGFQLAWSVLFIVWGRWLVRRAICKVVIQGG